MAALPTFTAALPALGKAATILSGIDTVFSTVNRVRDNSASVKAAQIQAEQQQATLAAERERQALATTEAEAERQRALRRAVSRKRAQFGAQGVSSGGSAEAVLLGLFDESEEERKARAQIENLRTRALDARAETNSRLNLLEQSQLAEQNRVDRILFG